MLRIVFLTALCASAAAFAPAPSALPSLHRTRAQCSSIAMKSEEDVAADTLAQRRIVVGGLFALLAPLAGLPQGAEAAKSGGRMGGGSFRPKAASPRAAPRAAAPAASRPSVTIINSAPAMPFGGGYGYGRPGMFGFGAWKGRVGQANLRTCPRESLAASCGVLLWRQSALKSLFVCRWWVRLRLDTRTVSGSVGHRTGGYVLYAFLLPCITADTFMA